MTGETLLRLPGVVRQPLGATLRRLPAPDAKLLAFLLSPAVRADPWQVYRELQQTHPVHRTAFGAWTVARHPDVAALARHPGLSVDEANASVSLDTSWDSAFGRLFDQTMLFRDPPDHERLRRLVARAFTPRRIEELRPRIEDLCRRRLNRMIHRGQTDLITDLAYPLPVDVICELLGIPDQDRDRFPAWASALAARLDVQPLRTAAINRHGDAAVVELTAYLRRLVADPRQRVAGGLIDGLVEAEEAGDRLSHDEVIATTALLLVAGYETTANLIGNGTYALLRHPDQMERLRNGEVAMATAVEELLRYDGPVQMTQRIAIDEVEVGGTTIPPGALIVLLLAAANRDPQAFDHPDDLDLSRSPNHHLAFSSGIHACLGASLARIETGVVIQQLLERPPRLRLAGRPRWRDTFVLRGVRSLPVAWDA
jgi:cytochrome P450